MNPILIERIAHDHVAEQGRLAARGRLLRAARPDGQWRRRWRELLATLSSAVAGTTPETCCA